MEKKKKYALQKGIAASLITFAIATGATQFVNNFNDKKEIEGNKFNIEYSFNSSISSQKTKELAKKLYEEYINKNYDEKIYIDWSMELAQSVVQLTNGVYPTAYAQLDIQERKQKMDELINFICLLEDESMSTTRSNNEVINLGDYAVDSMIKAIMNNSLMVGRQASTQSSFNDKFIYNAQHISTLNRNFSNYLDQLMDYEWETINSTDFFQSTPAEILVITSIWKSANKNIPKWYYIERDMSEVNKKEHLLYYRYFIDVEDYLPYYPRLNNKNEIEYALTYSDCHEDVYTEAEMYALAGLEEYYSGTYPYEETNLEPNVDIHQFGLEVEVENRYYEAVKRLSNTEIKIKEIKADNSQENNIQLLSNFKAMETVKVKQKKL